MADVNHIQAAPWTEPAAMQADVIIIGAGIAGVSAASALSGRGYNCVLISAHERHPPDFRAEKIAGSQMQMLDRLGLGDAARAQAIRFEGVWLHRFGHVAERSAEPEYASDYSDLVNALRAALPKSVRFVAGKVKDIETADDIQTVTLADRRRYSGRLLVVATGLGDAVRRAIGIEREVFSPAHSLSCGFDMALPETGLPFPSLIWSSIKFRDGLSYLTLFPLRDKVRANLFMYRTVSDDWTRSFKDHPENSLAATIPGLEDLFGKIKITSPVIARPIDLIRVRNYERPGVVLVGDAFSTVCPITGTGVDKALTDVEQLCGVHIPNWFKSPGMGWDKIGQYYADPVKVARDSSALKMSLESKRIKTDPSAYWTYRRVRSRTLGHGRLMVRAVLSRLLRSKSAG